VGARLAVIKTPCRRQHTAMTDYAGDMRGSTPDCAPCPVRLRVPEPSPLARAWHDRDSDPGLAGYLSSRPHSRYEL
jgi:hypothetical protein